MATATLMNVLSPARKDGYAVGAFNILDYQSMKAVIDTAASLSAPVIVQTSVKTVEYWGFRPMAGWYRELAGEAPVPVVLHLDHCKDAAFIRQCLDHGWTSVMIDASTKPFEENLTVSASVVDMAKPYQAGVEAELGAIVGVEDDIHVKQQDAHLADVDQSVRFCRETGVDCFAPAVGTAHGIYKGEPKIAFDRLEAISKQTVVPLALHGGTGLADGVFKRCISLGCAKINISTQLKYAFIDGFVRHHQANPGQYNPLKVLDAQYGALVSGIREKMVLFGCAGKAS